MTLQQLKAYGKSCIRKQAHEMLNMISSVRIAFHAQADEYTRIINDMKRDIDNG